MAFAVIETQEQLEKVIGERIRQITEREERKAAEKYADYDSLKAQVAALTDQTAKQTETLNGNKATIEELTAKVHTYETASVKTAVALEMGLPYQMASRLTGDTEDAIRADAQSMLELIGTRKPSAPLGSPEPTENSGAPGSLWATVASQINSEQ